MSAVCFWKQKAANRELALLRDLSDVGGNLGWKCFTGLSLSPCTTISVNNYISPNLRRGMRFPTAFQREEHCSCTVMSAWLRQKQRGRTTQGYCSHAHTQETSIRIKAQDVMQPSHLTIWMYLPGVHSSSQTAG